MYIGLPIRSRTIKMIKTIKSLSIPKLGEYFLAKKWDSCSNRANTLGLARMILEESTLC